MKDEEFDNKVYSALNKKLLPEFELEEQKDLGYYVGTIVLIYLILLGFVCVFNSYIIKEYKKPLIEFRL